MPCLRSVKRCRQQRLLPMNLLQLVQRQPLKWLQKRQPQCASAVPRLRPLASLQLQAPPLPQAHQRQQQSQLMLQRV